MIAQYRKLIAVIVGMIAMIVQNNFNVDIAGIEPDIVEAVTALLTVVAVWWFPNAKKPAVTGIKCHPIAVIGAAGLFLLLAACAGAQTSAQRIYAAGNNYEAAGRVALVYLHLPRCTEPEQVTCSKPSVVEEIKRADNVAHEALTQAQVVVADPAKTATLKDAALNAVTAATGVFTKVLAEYKIGESK